jgi:hypothetical protein
MPRQESVHRALRAEIGTLVEQGGVDLGGGQIHEARLVQPRQHGVLLVGGQGARRGAPLQGHVPGPPPTVVGRARQPERRTGGGNTQLRSDLGDRRYDEGSPVSGVPSNAATCFCGATRASARAARRCHRLISRACSASCLSRGSATRRTGPRFFGAVASSPRSRAARHVGLASLHATDKIQRDIEDVLLRDGLFYERRTNYYANQGPPASHIISPLYIASGYMTLVLKSPASGNTPIQIHAVGHRIQLCLLSERPA